MRKYESGLKPIWVNGITCPAAAVGFINCTLEEPLGFSNCSSGHILALDCGEHSVLTLGGRSCKLAAVRGGSGGHFLMTPIAAGGEVTQGEWCFE